MRIVLGSDHRGYKQTAHLAELLRAQGHETTILGACSDEPCDYPESAWKVGQAIRAG
ncbi:MAG: ribose-5-phosphate isomerase, partial [Planctomycetota bacterium]